MKFVAEYIWLDGKNNLRAKSRTVNISVTQQELQKRDIMKEILDVSLYKDWSYDGSSTWQAVGSDSEIIIKPAAVFSDPFRKAPNVLVLCDTYYPNGEPLPNNHRHAAKKIFEKKPEEKPWYGIEQEFFLMKSCKHCPTKPSVNPLGWSKEALPQGQYYCSVGANNAFGRKICEQAYHLCLESGVNASGMNAEVAPGQWEIQVGPCEGLDAGDHLLICRYILARVGEIHGVQINYHPKPLEGDWNGTGCHVNYSTVSMREEGGYEKILEAIKKLESKHMEHMAIYGLDNNQRMSGKHETSSYETFSYGVANRGASIRIPRETEREGKGYLEDRRPGGNIDPYQVTSKLFETTVLFNEEKESSNEL